MFWSKMNCEKLALYICDVYILPTIRYIFKVWHFANVKSTDTAIGLLNFEERGQCGFLSMIMDVGMMTSYYKNKNICTNLSYVFKE